MDLIPRRIVSSSKNVPSESELELSCLDLPEEFQKQPSDALRSETHTCQSEGREVQQRKQYLRCHESVYICQQEHQILMFFAFLLPQKELREKQAEMVKTVTAAENAINKLQLNTVSIEVNAARLTWTSSPQVCRNTSCIGCGRLFLAPADDVLGIGLTHNGPD